MQIVEDGTSQSETVKYTLFYLKCFALPQFLLSHKSSLDIAYVLVFRFFNVVVTFHLQHMLFQGNIIDLFPFVMFFILYSFQLPAFVPPPQ